MNTLPLTPAMLFHLVTWWDRMRGPLRGRTPFLPSRVPAATLRALHRRGLARVQRITRHGRHAEEIWDATYNARGLVMGLDPLDAAVRLDTAGYTAARYPVLAPKHGATGWRELITRLHKRIYDAEADGPDDTYWPDLLWPHNTHVRRFAVPHRPQGGLWYPELGEHRWSVTCYTPYCDYTTRIAYSAAEARCLRAEHISAHTNALAPNTEPKEGLSWR